MDLLFELEARSARQRLQLDDHVAELAVAARLLLVAALLRDRLADRFAVADGRRVALHLDAVAALQAGDDRVEMLVVDAAQADFVVSFVMLDDQAAVFLGQSLQSAGELDVVLAIGGFDRDRAVARRIFDLDRRRELAAAKPLASLDRIDLGDSDDDLRRGASPIFCVFSPWTLNMDPTRDVLAVVGLEV